LSNAWDRAEREQALAKFGLNPLEFQDRHELVVSSFERGKITLDEYLDRTVFYQPRPFTRQDFRDYMFSRSQPKPEALAFVRGLSSTGKYLMATINNESIDLNDYRIREFRLKEVFDLFISSCFVGLRKPERDIYRLALAITQRAPEECCFIDDRAVNLEQAACLGIHTIRMQGVDQLHQELAKLGVRID
jgi:putative hydrolase of the HAD superfamily